MLKSKYNRIQFFTLFIIIYIILLFFVFGFIVAQKAPTTIYFKCKEKINKDYVTDNSFGKSQWLKFEELKPLRDKIFINIQSDKPIIKSITPPDEIYPEGEINEFQGIVIHRSDKLLLIKWENPTRNKIWIATINLKYNKAIVTESYSGLTSFGMNVEILDTI